MTGQYRNPLPMSWAFPWARYGILTFMYCLQVLTIYYYWLNLMKVLYVDFFSNCYSISIFRPSDATPKGLQWTNRALTILTKILTVYLGTKWTWIGKSLKPLLNVIMLFFPMTLMPQIANFTHSHAYIHILHEQSHAQADRSWLDTTAQKQFIFIDLFSFD